MIPILSAFRRRERPLRLKPLSASPRGMVVLSYLREPFLSGNSSAARCHTNWHECRMMADAWRDEGFFVEVVDRKDRSYIPPKNTDAVIDLGVNLGRWAGALSDDCLKILHATGAHWSVQNSAEMRRLQNLAKRRGVRLKPRRQSLENSGIESADAASVLGNEFTIETFRFAGKKIHRIPISSAYAFSWPSQRDMLAARRRFLWMGSYGMVHKGLDLVLEAFVKMPDLELTVCGRPEKEEDFFNAYRRELTSSHNVRMAGWVDPASDEFEVLRNTHAVVLYPSCSEGGGGAVIHAMHAGLLPIVTREASVDVGSFGEVIRGETVQDVINAARTVADQPARAVESRARAAWEYVRTHHTAGTFRRNYHDFVRSCSAR